MTTFPNCVSVAKLLLCGLIIIAASFPQSARGAEVWLCAGERIAELMRPEAEWQSLQQHLSGIKLYVDQLNGATSEQLSALARFLKEHRYQVAVELGGCLDFGPMDDTAGEWSARHELAKLAKFYAAGGEVDFLDVDGPIRRLMHPENRRDGRRFDSVEAAAGELVDALRLHRRAHPKTRFWLLTNFPNWGWRGEVSYHARGAKRQDYGDYDQVVRVVLRKLKAADIVLEGVTVDNPYDYLVGEHPSVNLKDPKSVNWLQRVLTYEDFARAQGLAFNLIVNSERGGHESDERFSTETLQMVDLYRKAGGRPTRWFVQSWYPHPKRMTPEDAPHSMTALAQAVSERVRGDASVGGVSLSATHHHTTGGSGRILLAPRPGAMQVTARVPGLDNQLFALGIPETIGCREAMLVNSPEAKIEWQGPDTDGAVSCSWGPGGRISYELRLIPAEDYVDVEMTIRNHTDFLWHDVFAFNCLNPIQAPSFQDWKLERTYMSKQGQPFCMAKTTRVQGHMPTVEFYLPERVEAGTESVFVRGFGATSPDRTDGPWVVTLSEPAGAYMAATATEVAFLFDNLDRCCIHAAPGFGDIGPGEASKTVSRIYLAKGTLDTFLKRLETDRSGLTLRPKRARVAGPVTPAPEAVSDSPDRVLVGVNYFAGWWRPLPNKWNYDPAVGDWRTNYPGRVPLLGEYNTQETMDREILEAARHSVDFFLILWYYNGPGEAAEREKHARFLNEGLRTFILSPEAHRLRFAIEYCNHPPYEVKSDRDWEECTRAWLPAFRHGSYLRVGGKLVFKVHSWHYFWRENGENAAACRTRLASLRRSVREAGLGEMLIGCGVAANERIEPGHPAVEFFEFTNTYMDLPHRPAGDTDEPYDDLARFIRESRNQHAKDAVPYCPFLGAGFNARPWPDSRARFAFPTRDQWTLELRRVASDLDRIGTLGLPLPGGARQKTFTIYAWTLVSGLI